MFCVLLQNVFKNGTEDNQTGRNRSEIQSENQSDTRFYHVARGVHFANEKLQADDGVDDNDEEDQQSDVKQGNHGFNNGV